MITLTTTQCRALQKHVDAIQSIIRTATVSEDAPIVKSSAVTAKPHTAQPPKRVAAAVTPATFLYRHLVRHADRLTRLYQHLLRAQWLAADTCPDDFTALFLGKPTHAKVKWTGTQQHLRYLIRTLVNRGLISVPETASIWQITESHFINRKSRPFRDFNKRLDPVRAKPAIDRLADILDPSI